MGIETIPNIARERRNNKNIPDNGDDYILEGCNLSIESDDELTVTQGKLIIAHDGLVYYCTVGQRAGDNTISVPADSSLGVYYKAEQDNITLTNSEPSQPMLKLGSVDSSNGTTTEVNREPNIDANIDANRVNSDSVKTGDITDTDDGQAWESFREAGFEKGDFVPLVTSESAGKTSTSSTSFVLAGGRGARISIETSEIPEDPQYAVRAITQPDNTNVEFAVARVNRFPNLESVVTGTETVSSVSDDQLGTVAEVTLSGRERFQACFRSTDGNSHALWFGRVQFGVIL